MESTNAASTDASIAGGLRGTFKSVLALVLSRLELAVLEFSDIGTRTFKLFLLCALSILALLLALGFFTALIVALAWPSLGWKVLLILAVVFSLATIGLAMVVRHMLVDAPLSFPATMAELRNDRDTLL